jgi:hypothetical protein
MLKKILIGLVVVIVAFVGFVATRPAEFKIARSTNISASPMTVYEQVVDFNKHDWSPWMKLDPNMEKKIEGTPGAVGHSQYWKGNDEVGEGKQTISAVKPGEQIEVNLEFIKPFEANNHVVYDFKAENNGTNITWAMDGHNNFMSKLFSTFVDMDKMVGADFEKGLAALKVQAEAAEKAKLEQAAAAAAAQAVDAAKADEAAPAEGEAKTATP